MLQNYSTWAVLRQFFDHPEKEFSLAELARQSQLAHTSVKIHLAMLMKKGLVLQEKKKIASRIFPVFQANAQNTEYRFYRKIDIVERMHTTGLIEKLIRETSPDCIVLFGSAARGEDGSSSDIDIYVQARKKELDLRSYERLLSRKIELHWNEKFRDYPEELRNSIANGIKLYGTLTII